jgi:peptide chain release factor 3
MFANERTTVEEGFAGDVIGLTNPGAFGKSAAHVL